MFFQTDLLKISALRKSERRFFITSAFVLLSQYSFSQTWEYTFGGTLGFKMMETYDKGFAILGTTGPQSNSRIFLLKTDIDGNMLWNKTIGNGSFFSAANSIDITADGGYILSGYTTQYDPMGAAFVLKLDACGAKEWCHIYGLLNNYDWARCVYQLNDGNYIVLASLFGPDTLHSGRVGLMKLNTIGNILWNNDYSHYKSSDASSLLLTRDNGFLLSGNCYIQNPGDSAGPYILRTLVIKVDSGGIEQWNIPYGAMNYFYSRGGAARQTPESGYLELCTFRDSINPYDHDWSYIFRADASGNVLWGKQIGDSSKSEWDLDILALNDSQSVCLAALTDTFNSNIYNIKLLKIDTAGNILDSAIYGYSTQSPDGKLEITHDGKILVCSTKDIGGNNYDIYALKLNEHLQLDTMYNFSLNYDSLCSTGITSGFISLDTMSYVGVEEVVRDEGEFLVYPNPATNQLRIKNSGFRIESIELFSILGEKVFSEHLPSQPVGQGTPDSQLQTTFSVSHLPNGIYFLSVKSKEKIWSQKIIISR
jgi:hypothetical protein